MWWLFACCRRAAPPAAPGLGFGYALPAEQTPLLAAEAGARRVDQQKMKERLGNIVRAKEGCVASFLFPLPQKLTKAI